MQIKKNAIVIPIYQTSLSPEEIFSISQAARVLAKHDLYFVGPERLGVFLAGLSAQFGRVIGYKTFPDHYFAGIDGYNRLMLSSMFYRAFIDYEVYGDPSVHPQPEEYWGNVNSIGIRSCYDEGKRAAETLFFDYQRVHSINIKLVRIFNTYGPRMAADDGRVVSNFIVQALRGQELTVYGDGSQTRSFCYSDDLVSGFMRLMNASDEIRGPINMGNPGEFTMIDLAEKVLRLTGSKSKLIHMPLPQDDPKQRRPDITKAKQLLKWEPTIALEQGLERTIDYFRKLVTP